jgi:uncharacterized membrane protein
MNYFFWELFKGTIIIGLGWCGWVLFVSLTHKLEIKYGDRKLFAFLYIAFIFILAALAVHFTDFELID